MTRNGMLGIAIAVILAAIAGNAYLGITNQAKLSGETARLADTQRQIALTQRIFEQSQKSSTKTRITTVKARCDLTRQILGVLTAHDLGDSRPFQRSLAECLIQLRAVAAIDAKTP